MAGPDLTRRILSHTHVELSLYRNRHTRLVVRFWPPRSCSRQDGDEPFPSLTTLANSAYPGHVLSSFNA